MGALTAKLEGVDSEGDRKRTRGLALDSQENRSAKNKDTKK